MSREGDPQRLSKAAPDSPLGRLFTSAERDLPTDQELGQLAARLAGVLEPMPLPPAASPGLSLWAKLGATIGLAALVGAGVWALRRPGAVSHAPSPVLSASATVASAPDLSGLAGAPALPGPAPAKVMNAAPQAPVLLKQPTKQTAAEGPSEPALLEQARRDLAASPAAALALTTQHAARFPHGVLTQEREVIAIEALRRLGRGAEADRRAAAFARAFPGSAHRRMVLDPSPK
ncbi:MAG: hypothetical protein ABJB12_18850 [Pseudomonadota bacterium]